MKTLVNATAGFSLVVDALKVSEILDAVQAAELSIGQTSLRSLLKGDVESVKGFTLVDVAETPVDTNPEWNHAALAAAHPKNAAAEEKADEPEVTTWSMGSNIDFLASKTSRLTRKYNRVAKSPLLAEVTAVDFVTTKVGRVVTDHIVMKKGDEVLYTLYPTKRSAHENIAEVYDGAGELLIRASWGRVVEFFKPSENDQAAA